MDKPRFCTICELPLHGDPQAVDLCDEHEISAQQAGPELLVQLREAMRLAATLEDLLKDNGMDVSAEQAGWDAQHVRFRVAIARATGRE